MKIKLLFVAMVILPLLFNSETEALRKQQNWAQRVESSDTIIRGEVLSIETRWDAGSIPIVTDIKIKMHECIKGEAAEEVLLTLPGGTIGSFSVTVSEAANFTVGQNGIYLISSGFVGAEEFWALGEEPRNKAVGATINSPAENKFLTWIRDYVKGSTTTTYEEIETQETAEMRGAAIGTVNPIITSVSPDVSFAGVGNILKIAGSGFGPRPSGDLPAIGVKYKGSYINDKSKILSWTDSQILMNLWLGESNWDGIGYIDASNKVVAVHKLNVPFWYTGNKWPSPSADLWVNPTGGPTGMVDAVFRAADKWSAAGSPFRFNNRGQTSAPSAYDGITSVSMGTIPSQFLAWCVTYAVNGVITEFDVVINTAWAWTTTNEPGKWDLMDVAIHEIGHGLQEMDIYGENDLGKAMYGYALNAVNELTPDDRAGAMYLYGGLSAIELVFMPNAPKGPSSGSINKQYTFFTGGSASSVGHPAQYYIDWGEGLQDNGWLPEGQTQATHRWNTSGSYKLRSRAKAGERYSAWSYPISVYIDQGVSPPSYVTGPAEGYPDINYQFQTGGSYYRSDFIDYQFGWGDGTYSDWNAGIAQKSWSTPGKYFIQSQARSVNDNELVSNFGAGMYITIQIPEKISRPNLTGQTRLAFDAIGTYNASAVSNLNHTLQYIFFWGDDTNSDWLPAGQVSTTKSWSIPGTYRVTVQARCATDNEKVSALSDAFEVIVVVPIVLFMPADWTSYGSCSVNNQPTFSWNVQDSFASMELQFSGDNNSIQLKVSAQSNTITISSELWKKVFILPGMTGGTVYWRVSGTRADGSIFNTEFRILTIEQPKAVSNPLIVFTKVGPPTITWQNNCNAKARLSIGNGEFSKKLVFEFALAGDKFSFKLKNLDWLRLKLWCIKDRTIHLKVETCDELGRQSVLKSEARF